MVITLDIIAAGVEEKLLQDENLQVASETRTQVICIQQIVTTIQQVRAGNVQEHQCNKTRGDAAPITLLERLKHFPDSLAYYLVNDQ